MDSSLRTETGQKMSENALICPPLSVVPIHNESYRVSLKEHIVVHVYVVHRYKAGRCRVRKMCVK